jgi:hypothetical protein
MSQKTLMEIDTFFAGDDKTAIVDISTRGQRFGDVWRTLQTFENGGDHFHRDDPTGTRRLIVVIDRLSTDQPTVPTPRTRRRS